jgi:hypothetical protein
MILIMILSGFLSSMYIWADKLSDVRIAYNDIYMVGLMTSWMILFMAFLQKDLIILLVSLGFVILFLYYIRTQKHISKKQYYKGMIPHHSMAVLMSRRLLENDKTLSPAEILFVKNIISTQNAEIDQMKLLS